MPRLMRIVSKLNDPLWLKPPQFPWIGEGDVPSDFLKDFNSNLALESEPTPGQTHDSQANAWHITLIKLTGFKIVALIRTILDQDYDSDKRDLHEVGELVARAVAAERIPRDKLNKDWKAYLDKKLLQPSLL